MDAEQTMMAALSPLPCPVSKPPADGGEETYCTFFEALGTPTGYASNAPTRVRHSMQVHIFSRRDDGTHRVLMGQAVKLLRAARVRVTAWGPDTYETDTGYHHIAISCLMATTEKEEGQPNV